MRWDETQGRTRNNDESVDMAEEIIDEIDEQLNSDKLKHFMLHFHKGIYDDELEKAMEFTKFQGTYDNNLGVNIFADRPAGWLQRNEHQIEILKTKIHPTHKRSLKQPRVRKNANGQRDRVIWHNPT